MTEPTVNGVAGVGDVAVIKSAFSPAGNGLELIEPGLVPCPRWRPDPGDAAGARDMDEYCGLGRK